MAYINDFTAQKASLGECGRHLAKFFREPVSDRLWILLLKLKGYRICKIGTVKGELHVLSRKSSSGENYWMNLSCVATEHLTSLTFCGFPVFEHDLTLNS